MAPDSTVTNARIARALHELGDALEIEGANRFRVRAYRTAAQSLESLPRPVAEVAAEGGVKALASLPNIGESMAKKIAEMLETGQLTQLEQIREEVPPELSALLELPGLGPKRVHLLREQLGVSGVDDLERVVREGKVAALKGFGKQSAEKILKSIAQVRKYAGRFRLSDVEPYALAIQERLLAQPGVRQVEIAGSFRRVRETVGDVDILCSASRAGEVMNSFVSFDAVQEVVMQGDTRTSVRLENGLQVDLRLVPEETFGAALHYFTGSKAHNVAMRTLARQKGYKVNEYGVFRGERRVAGGDETDVFDVIGAQYIPPELRENNGEIEAATKGTLPALVELGEVAGDLQMHTTASDGRHSIEEMARAAKALGREYVAITDHSKAVAVAGGLDDAALLAHSTAIRNTAVPGVRILAGVEVDILRDGSLDLKDRTLRQLDVVVGSVHGSMQLRREQMTRRIIRAVESGLIHILAHPTGRLINEREPFEVDLKAVIEACVENGVALEINAHPYRLDLSDVHSRLAKELGAKLIISTDAHSTADLALMRFGVGVARRAWLEREDILNTLPVGEFLGALR